MLVSQIFKIVESFDRTITLDAAIKIIHIILGYNHHAVSANEISTAVELILEKMPEVSYTGSLYRTVFVDASVVLRSPSIQAITSQIHAAETNDSFDTNRKWYSWTSRLESAESFAAEYLDDNRIACLLSKHDTGLDVTKLTKTNMLDEHEVITQMSGNVHVVKLAYLDDQEDQVKFVDAAQFRDFIAAVKRSYDPTPVDLPQFNQTRRSEFDHLIYDPSKTISDLA